MPTVSIKSTHEAVRAYYETLEAHVGRNISDETAIRLAFQNLLAETGKPHKWTLVLELAMKVKGRPIRPDGTMREGLWMFLRGYRTGFLIAANAVSSDRGRGVLSRRERASGTQGRKNWTGPSLEVRNTRGTLPPDPGARSILMPEEWQSVIGHGGSSPAKLIR
ncbi:MAG: hypothetical protein NVSMB9_12460 [Isosphaeraceae bacterium]